ncbi:MAG: hypothetical protein J3R72DRAFT_421081 [Linnemannia gamsii]|nr:MAG: hypothetical protein J3R72DRAFT_421081 [Linnemannia gamsii]
MVDPTWVFFVMPLYFSAALSPVAASSFSIFSPFSSTSPVVELPPPSHFDVLFHLRSFLSHSTSAFYTNVHFSLPVVICSAVLFARWLYLSPVPSQSINIQQTSPPSSRAFSIFSSTQEIIPAYEVKAADWPSYDEDGVVPFTDFVNNFKSTFADRKIHPSYLFACFVQSLSGLKPATIAIHRPFDDKSIHRAVLLLSGPLYLDLSTLRDRRRKLFSPLSQKFNQSFIDYYLAFTKEATLHPSILPLDLLHLFFYFLNDQHKTHLNRFYSAFLLLKKPASSFYDDAINFILIHPAPPPTFPSVSATPRLSSTTPDANPDKHLATHNSTRTPRHTCRHCGKHHPSNFCYTKFPLLNPNHPEYDPAKDRRTRFKNNALHDHLLHRQTTFLQPQPLLAAADISCISSNLFEATDLHTAMVPNSIQAIITATGDIQYTLGSVRLLMHGTVITLHVLRDLVNPIIIGWDTLQSFSFSISNQSLPLTTKHSSHIDISHTRALPLPSASGNTITVPFTLTRHLPIRPMNYFNRLLTSTSYDPQPHFDRLLESNSDIFATNPTAPLKSHITEFVIDTGSASLQHRSYPQSSAEKEKMDRHIDATGS